MNDEEFFETEDENASIMACSVCGVISEVELRPTGAAFCKFCLKTAQEAFGLLGGEGDGGKKEAQEEHPKEL
jgi:hypothetical protein|tara:strand:+ start:1771 stop:1986 length:216 start_codon:yes stop_codon:yes gene_type:complete